MSKTKGEAVLRTGFSVVAVQRQTYRRRLPAELVCAPAQGRILVPGTSAATTTRTKAGRQGSSARTASLDSPVLPLSSFLGVALLAALTMCPGVPPDQPCAQAGLRSAAVQSGTQRPCRGKGGLRFRPRLILPTPGRLSSKIACRSGHLTAAGRPSRLTLGSAIPYRRGFLWTRHQVPPRAALRILRWIC